MELTVQKPKVMPISSEAIRRYVLRRGEEIKPCLEAIEGGNFNLLRETAHKILGNCLTFGFEELQAVAGALHASATQQNRESCLKAVKRLEAWVVANQSAV